MHPFLILVTKASFPSLLLSFNKISISFDHGCRHVMSFSLINSPFPGQSEHPEELGMWSLPELFLSVEASRKKCIFLKNALIIFIIFIKIEYVKKFKSWIYNEKQQSSNPTQFMLPSDCTLQCFLIICSYMRISKWYLIFVNVIYCISND